MISWDARLFVVRAEAAGHTAQQVQAMRAYAERLLAQGCRWPLFSLVDLAHQCRVPYASLDDVINRRKDPYRHFTIKKRSGGFRQICVPSIHLRRAQRWIHEWVLFGVPSSAIATAYAPGMSAGGNARRHSGARGLVKIDIVRFFESISERQVYHAYRALGFDSLLSFQLARLCTYPHGSRDKYESGRWKGNPEHWTAMSEVRVGHLPQGAPTSPVISNMVCAALDQRLSEIALQNGWVVTRYADDIVFSGQWHGRGHAQQLLKEARAALWGSGFKSNHRKEGIHHPGSRRVVTGFLVDRSEPKLVRSYRERIRQHLYYCWKRGVGEHCARIGFESVGAFAKHLRGQIEYLKHWHPTSYLHYVRHFEDIEWPPEVTRSRAEHGA